MPKTIASSQEVAARWSFAEVTGRFATEYSQNHTDDASVALIAKIHNGAPFVSLNQTERDLLAHWFSTGYRQQMATTFYQWYTSFRLENWTKSKLARVHTLPIIDPLQQYRSLTFISYLAHPRKTINGTPDLRDPAVKADTVSMTTVFHQTEPLVIGHWNDGRLVLWEGNFRAVLFARTPDPRATVEVWMPHEGSWPGK